MISRKVLITTVVAGLAMLILIGDALAIPVFARKYRTSCITCHEAFPRRNSVGEAFRLNGFQFEDDEIYRKEEPVELGDEAYERLWPKAIWPTDIPLTVPISILSRFLMEVDLDGSRKNPVTFLLPEELELVWAGNLGPNIAFYGDIIYLQKDFGGQPISAWTTLKAWLEFRNLIGQNSHFNLRLGTVGTHSMGLSTALDSNNYSTHFYQYTTWIMPGVDLEAAGLTWFEGNPFSAQPQMGFELNGHGARWSYATGIVAGNAMAPPDHAPDSPIAFNGTAKNVDNKDLYGQLSFKFGGLPYHGLNEAQADPQAGEPNTLTAKADYWRDDSLQLSFWGYWGKAQIVTLVGNDEENKWKGNSPFWRAGAGLLQRYRNINLGAGYVFGNDDNPYGSLTSESVDSRTWFAETLWYAYPWLMPFVRYEGMSLDLPQDVPGVPYEWEIRRMMPGLKAMLRPNLALTLEVPIYFEGGQLEEGFDRSLFMMLSMAF